MEYTILVVEDEKEIRDAIEIYLKTQGYHVLKASHGKEALDILAKETVHLGIVDIMMPIMDGIEMTMKAKELYDFPIIMLSAKSEDLDKITGLNIGADDYVTKPFVPMELLARVAAQLRRYSRYLNAVSNNKVLDNCLTVGGLELNLDTKQVTVNDKIIKVTPIEFKILQLLMEYPGKVFSAENIYESVWNEDAISTDTVMVHVRNLREKIELDPKNPQYLKVVWGIGYKIEK
ncbi:MAG: response regulator transcription factor [Coprobacillus sp.]